jgi:hypothetical protein
MLVQSPTVKHLVDQYDIFFDSGAVMPVTVDTEAGDSMNVSDKFLLFTLSAKPSLSNPENLLPAEDVTVFLPHVISIQHRQVERVEPNPDQQAEWREIWEKMATPKQIM